MKTPEILIADDEEIIRNLFERFLTSEGYKVSTAIDGQDALDKITKENYDLVILDLKMPRLDGLETLKKVKELNKDSIIIMLTGFATVETAKEAIKQGCYDYITKPFNIEDLSLVIKRAFNMRRLTADKIRLEEQLRVAERLASLAEMGAAVSHEVNTVLTSIKLFLDMLKPKLSPTEKEGRNLNLILDEVERAEKLILKFLNFAKPTASEFTRTDINEVVRKILLLCESRLAKQKIEISQHLDENIPVILCDSAKMGEVFLNIFSNSIEAMPEGGKLSITTSVQEKNLVIDIEDAGIGIPPENINKIYDPFFTTKQNGTGLGLSIVHRIIEEHKGIIKITSEDNKGTFVRIELPI